MIYSNNDWYLSRVGSVIQECELIVKFPTRTLEASPLKKFKRILQKGQCDDFSKECMDAGEAQTSKIFPLDPLNPFGPLVSFGLERAMEKRALRKATRDLYARGRLAKVKIVEQLGTEKAQDRYLLLKLAYFLLNRIEYELKEKLIK